GCLLVRAVHSTSGQRNRRNQIASVPIHIEEHIGIRRVREPVTIGLPFPRGLLPDITEVSLPNSAGPPGPAQGTVLARWSDGSVKWALFDFLVDLDAYEKKEMALVMGTGRSAQPRGINAVETENGFVVETGGDRFTIERDRLVLRWSPSVDSRGSNDHAQ